MKLVSSTPSRSSASSHVTDLHQAVSAEAHLFFEINHNAGFVNLLSVNVGMR